MATVEEAALALEAALKTVPGIRVYTDPGATVDPPAALLGPPQLTWSDPGPEPTSGRFVVVLMVAADERAMSRLWGLVPQVVAAVENTDDAVVKAANPGVWASGGQQLPCYEIQIEMSL